MKNIRKYILIPTVCAALLLALSGCADENKPADTTTAASGAVTEADGKVAPPVAKPTEDQLVKSTAAGNSGTVTLESGDTYAVISVRDFGDITVKLYPDEVPYGVYNFVELAKSGAYNGRNFHRIMDDFMIQGGSPNGLGYGGDSYEGGVFRNEINTSLRHYYGALCYASANGDMSDQFYIVNNKTPENDIDNYYQNIITDYENRAVEYQSSLDELTGIINSLDPASDPEYEDKLNYYSYYYSVYSQALESTKATLETNRGPWEAMYDSITDGVRESYKNGGVPFLDGGYTVFGQTVEGFDVIDKITAVEKDYNSGGELSVPKQDIIIDKIEIFTKE